MSAIKKVLNKIRTSHYVAFAVGFILGATIVIYALDFDIKSWITSFVIGLLTGYGANYFWALTLKKIFKNKSELVLKTGGGDNAGLYVEGVITSDNAGTAMHAIACSVDDIPMHEAKSIAMVISSKSKKLI